MVCCYILRESKSLSLGCPPKRNIKMHEYEISRRGTCNVEASWAESQKHINNEIKLIAAKFMDKVLKGHGKSLVSSPCHKFKRYHLIAHKLH